MENLLLRWQHRATAPPHIMEALQTWSKLSSGLAQCWSERATLGYAKRAENKRKPNELTS
jgi:hypothetical protein